MDLINPSDGLYNDMVVIHRAFGFRFVIYTLDHEPAHVHITGPGQAKINLTGRDGQPEVIYSVGIKQSDMRRLLSEAAERRDEFLKEWERIHGRND
ncbi:DUF4160 domain-containing protein [Mesorhizobium sp. A623]